MMKTLHFASILALSAATVFACNDNEDRRPPSNVSGTTSEAGEPSVAGNGPDNEGGAGGGAAVSDVGGSGSAGEPNEAGSGGSGGEAAGGEAAGGEAAGGEAGAGGGGGADPFELIGAYDDNYGGSFVVTAGAWASSAIAAYDNAQNTVYTQFPADDLFNPNKFAKTVYTEPTGGSFYFCMVEFSADTLGAAQSSSATADDSDPENGGCGGQFPWTKATEK